ncbi:hypothetical protein SAMD00019534_095860 [Acytostelium subglobosum LB1]|uniref:hypothetical protein n=1 Tax=Acytostelium subglobosum LB1 TaxID=1410327 RepID=UPI000644AA11|nr:hypothetical protein SAMD00019534_095860 [Acytostelium subglobosum LB1]GAM26411.1 hypothetical protein SAMD00019534_095860 [Acytostelium subglobosum LB1]|eukprot:XP_012750507.1 hypothetical protein SAMD00019534_095860 [Acytostelium subglobosum LB1]
MLVLFETPAGYALFKVLDEGKIKSSPSTIHQHFTTPEKASKIVSLKKFYKFDGTLDALESCTALAENTVPESLSNFLTKNIIKEKLTDMLAVCDTKFGNAIKEAGLNIKIICDDTTQELIRGIRSQINSLVTGLSESDLNAMSIGLSHSYSRYKLKFSPDKVDTMIVHAISLLDELNTELNIYGMRAREWYGWHFPELGKIIGEHSQYCKAIKLMGDRKNAAKHDFEDILPEEIASEVKEAAQISMGTDISEEDLDHIFSLCDQYISFDEYRQQLSEYLKNRMNAIAPNLTILVGEVVGARLICKAGSLMNLAKYPASTIQILGAEKALFRAIKTKNNTPKYGLIYNAKLVGDASLKNKGKMSRVLAAKAALSIRFDALCEASDTSYGITYKSKVEQRAIDIENGVVRRTNNNKKKPANQTKYDHTKGSNSLQTRTPETKVKKESNIKQEKKDSSDEDTEMSEVAETKMEVEKTNNKKKPVKKESSDESSSESSSSEEEVKKPAKKEEKKVEKKEDKKKPAKKESSDESSSEEEVKKPAKKEDKKSKKEDKKEDKKADKKKAEVEEKTEKKSSKKSEEKESKSEKKADKKEDKKEDKKSSKKSEVEEKTEKKSSKKSEVGEKKPAKKDDKKRAREDSSEEKVVKKKK